ncbi:HTTM domain-containing protein [Chitinophaga sp. CB10]|uniref:HTTM domain-containing protein n=1 Tax=Chitinophaga sp. CB10 TaxID=1891659 RepID=UPI000A653634|nr:HTTM domain-containing protein [Chitinophaga sp. CB10]
MTATNASRWQRPVSIAPLVTFRIVFGLLMFGSLLRFVLRGWVDTLYIQPSFHFTYWGFEWVQPFSGTGMYVLFGVILLSTLLIAAGLFYRIAAIVFFLGFTYVELIDVTTYLNHYYFISLVAFLMIWLPANRRYAVDTVIWPGLRRDEVPAWTIGLLRFQLAIVYIYAGLAKINPDWLLQAEPMKTWLPARSHLPIVGPLMYQSWVAYVFSWFGCIYDCFIVFFLLNRRTRPWAYAVVVVFHVATAVFFPGIGMFPYVMIVATLIFFSGSFHERLLSLLPGYASAPNGKVYTFVYPQALQTAVILYAIVQLLLPLRFLLYPDHLFWNEEGYRFSWRVMLMEKAGTAYFTVKEAGHGRATTINNADYLTPLQEKMMSTQPDMILKYAYHLRNDFEQKGWKNPEVYAEIYVALNGQRSRLFIDSTVNLAAQPLSWRHYKWILPYK